MATMGERLREARIRKNMTQVELGRLLNVSNLTINRYENGLRKPDPEMLIKLAEQLEISTDFLLKGPNYDLGNRDWVINWFRSLPLEIQEFLHKEDSLAWLEIAHKMKKHQVSVKSAEILTNAFIEAFNVPREEDKNEGYEEPLNLDKRIGYIRKAVGYWIKLRKTDIKVRRELGVKNIEIDRKHLLKLQRDKNDIKALKRKYR